MKAIILSLFILNLAFGMSSPFKSSVEEISINNFHEVGTYKRVYRGQAPLGKIEQLVKFGITDILIFKNQTRNEIDKELKELNEKAGKTIKYKRIDFLWHKYPSYKKACQQMIAGLKYIKEVDSNKNRKIFIHCTVGEDRTGALSGLWRMLSQRYSMKNAFKNEMCENGYGHGNKNKPPYVYGEIRRDLTPLFQYIASKIEDKTLTLANLNDSICKDKIPMKHNLKCAVSSKFPKE